MIELYTVQDKIRIKPIEGEFEKLEVSWDPVPGVAEYRIYCSPHEFTKTLIGTGTSPYIIDLPDVPPDTVWFIWVSYLNNQNQEIFLQNSAASLITQKNLFLPENNPLSPDSNLIIPNYMMLYYFSEIRRRHRAILENDGEDFEVYIRRWTGQPCSCVPGTPEEYGPDPDLNMDTSYQGRGRHINCFGTGIVGGYYPKITIKARYGDIPERKIIFDKGQGLILPHDFNSWTLWVPKLHEKDILVRKRTNDRFIVEDIAQSEWRGFPLHQKMKLRLLPPEAFEYKITNEAIEKAFENEGVFGKARFNFSVWN